jgi:hypothetical protein
MNICNPTGSVSREMVGVIDLFRVRRREAAAQAGNLLTQPQVGELPHFTKEES